MFWESLWGTVIICLICILCVLFVFACVIGISYWREIRARKKAILLKIQNQINYCAKIANKIEKLMEENYDE